MRSIILSSRLSFFLLTLLVLLSLRCSSNNQNHPPVTANTISLANILSERQFNGLFPMRNKFYSYAAFIKAATELGMIKLKVTRRATSVYQFIRTDKRTGKSTIIRQDEDWNEDWAKKKPDSAYVIDYGAFCTEKDPQTNKKELAAFFAQIAHETRHGEDGTFTDGLMYIHENDTTNSYIADNDTYPAVAGAKYYGRGPMQLSYNGNYGYASDCIFGNKHILLNNPGLIETDPVVAFKNRHLFLDDPSNIKTFRT